MTALGFDTSNYTTSTALYGDTVKNCSRLLPVREGALGLRQSDAVFSHINAIYDLLDELYCDFDGRIDAVGVSYAPRRVEGSYMPCFKVGETVAKSIARTLGVPCHLFSHQEGHLASALFTTGNESLIEKTFLAWHLSGGTTELLRVEPGLKCVKIGGTSDISAGQLIDRCGVMLGLKFPAGRELDSLAGDAKPFKIKEKELSFSLSGMENKVREMKADKEYIAGFVMHTIADIIYRITNAALKEYGDLPVLITGGVGGSRVLRLKMLNAIYCEPKYSADNALGIAALANFKGGK